MDVRNCKMCGRLFNYIDNAVCPACEKQLEEKFIEAREYIKENPGCSMGMVSDALDISLKQIKTWIRQERLTFGSPEASGICCEQCGQPIASGRYCKSCKTSISTKLDNAYEKPKAVKLEPVVKKQDANSKMRYMGR